VKEVIKIGSAHSTQTNDRKEECDDQVMKALPMRIN
jgi:hypothetical protein